LGKSNPVKVMTAVSHPQEKGGRDARGLPAQGELEVRACNRNAGSLKKGPDALRTLAEGGSEQT